MNYCKYHPLSSSPWFCSYCEISVCKQCVDGGKHGDQFNCVLCGRGLDAQAVASEACVPFWRRLQESFRYPLNTNSLTLIIGFGLVSAIMESAALFFIAAVGIYLMMLSAMLKYCFSCLEHTSLGDMQAPDITEAYGGGFQTLGHLFLMIVFLGAVVMIVAHVFGEALAGLAAMILAMGFPAVLINYALSGSLLSAVNLGSMFRLIGTIGLPYGLLIAFIAIMSGSVGVIHGLIGNSFSFISSFLQYVVTWYYTIVTFHIMGYMIYQYQDRLGFVAHGNDDVENTSSFSEEQNLHAKINVFLKEGELNKAVTLFEEAVSRFPQSEFSVQRYFDFLVRTRSRENLGRFASTYLNFQLRRSRYDKPGFIYKQIIAICPDYVPEEAELRFYTARASLRSGDPGTAIKLLRGLHKTHPEFEHLIEAYEVMHEAMQSLPNMEEQSLKCKALLAHLRKQKPQTSRQAQQPRKAMFAASEPGSTLDEAKADQQIHSEEPATAEPDKPKDLPPIEFKP